MEDRRIIAQRLAELRKNSKNQDQKLDDIEDNTSNEPNKVKDPLKNMKTVKKVYGSHNRL